MMMGCFAASLAMAATAPSPMRPQVGTVATQPATQATPTPAAKTPPETTITYEDAEHHIGDKLVIHTKNKTTRVGLLTKYTKSMLTLNVEVSGGTVEFTFDKYSVASIGLLPAPPPPAADSGTPSAKKN